MGRGWSLAGFCGEKWVSIVASKEITLQGGGDWIGPGAGDELGESSVGYRNSPDQREGVTALGMEGMRRMREAGLGEGRTGVVLIELTVAGPSPPPLRTHGVGHAHKARWSTLLPLPLVLKSPCKLPGFWESSE